MQFDDFGKFLEGNLGNLFASVQKAQQNLEKIQEELKNLHSEGSAGGGKVKVLANGKQQIVKITIDPEVVLPGADDIELLEDMIVAAVNQALEKTKQLAENQMSNAAGGLDLEKIQNMFRPGS